MKESYVTAIDNIDEKIKEKDTKLIAKSFMDAVNDFCFNAQKAAEYVYSRGTDFSVPMVKLAHKWVKKLAEQNEHGYYDGRNEYSVHIGAIINRYPLFTSFTTVADDEWMDAVVEIISKDHRTLQQTFSAMIFKLIQISYRSDENFAKYIQDNLGYGEDWWRMPLI